MPLYLDGNMAHREAPCGAAGCECRGFVAQRATCKCPGPHCESCGAHDSDDHRCPSPALPSPAGQALELCVVPQVINGDLRPVIMARERGRPRFLLAEEAMRVCDQVGDTLSIGDAVPPYPPALEDDAGPEGIGEFLHHYLNTRLCPDCQGRTGPVSAPCTCGTCSGTGKVCPCGCDICRDEPYLTDHERAWIAERRRALVQLSSMWVAIDAEPAMHRIVSVEDAGGAADAVREVEYPVPHSVLRNWHDVASRIASPCVLYSPDPVTLRERVIDACRGDAEYLRSQMMAIMFR